MGITLPKVLAAAALGLAAAAVAWHLRGAPAAVQVVEGEVQIVVSGPGTVQARVPVAVASRIPAQVVTLHADHGELVRKGQLLARLDDRDLAAKRAAGAAGRESVRAAAAAAGASLQKARAELELARNRHLREAELHRARFISQSAYDSAALGLRAAEAAVESAAATLEARRADARGIDQEAHYAEVMWSHARISAPMDGLVIQRAVEPGTTVAPGTILFRLVDPATLWIAARIDEALVGRLAEGMPAAIRLRSGETHAGRVARISRQSDAATRELDVYVAFDHPPERFAIDQEAEVRIVAGVARGPAVPLAAIVRRDGREGVHVVRDGRTVFQPVRLSASDGTIVIIAEGLPAGARLAAWTSR